MAGTRQPGGHREIINATGNITLTSDDVGKIVTNRGAAGAVVVTLPAANSTNAGGTILVLPTADQNLTVSGTADTMIILNDLTADSVAVSTAGQKIGGGFEMVSDGVGWHALVLGAAGTQTVTTAT
jgi:hypothetical protein